VQYMLLIYSEPGAWRSLSEEERSAMYEEYFALSRRLQAEEKLVSSNELQPSSTATTVQVSGGETAVTDGPFAETKEVLGGYYLIEAESLDDAIRWAAQIPAARHGKVEVRPVVTREAESKRWTTEGVSA
jgi:hypothetical protein